MPLYRFSVGLTGFSGAPGVNTLYLQDSGVLESSDLNTAAGLIRTAYDSVKAWLSNDVRVNIGAEVAVINIGTGALEDTVIITAPSQVQGQSQAAMSRATHAKLRFKTDVVVGGRNLRGGPFIGPLGSQAMELDGTILASARASLGAMFDGVMDILGTRLVVWHRPSAPGMSDGQYGNVQTVSVGLKPASLRSRRD